MKFWYERIIVLWIIKFLKHRRNYNSGLINSYLMNWFGDDAKVGWVRDAKVVKFSIIIMLIWQFTGLNSLYFLAGLQNIPRELEEAAAIDGANWWTTTTRSKRLESESGMRTILVPKIKER